MKNGILIMIALLALSFSVTGLSAEDAKPVEITKPAEDTKPAVEKSYIGTVKSFTTAGKYSYLQLDQDGKEIWIATEPKYLKINVSAGDKVEYMGGVTMSNFESKAMGKTFDSITLITRIHVLNKELPKDEFHKTSLAVPEQLPAPKAGEIAKAKDGKTISELFSEGDKLKDIEVILRAKVMKLSKNVLKKNWLTLQDGTGSAPDDKLTATTAETANPGDVIILKGLIKTNVDIGAGYKYKILLEDAKIIK